MSVEKLLDAIVIEPKGAAQISAIWLHGLGVDGNDFKDIGPMLGLPSDLNARFIFPHAPMRPVTINNGMTMRAWFDIFSTENLNKNDEPGIRQSQKLINAWLDHEVNLVGSQNVFLIGFSQGGALACHCALRYPQSLAGCAILSGYIILPQTITTESSIQNKELPLFMGHGSQDPMVRFELAQQSAAQLSHYGWKPDFHEYAMGHNVCGPEISLLGRWMQDCIKL